MAVNSHVETVCSRLSFFSLCGRLHLCNALCPRVLTGCLLAHPYSVSHQEMPFDKVLDYDLTAGPCRGDLEVAGFKLSRHW